MKYEKSWDWHWIICWKPDSQQFFVYSAFYDTRDKTEPLIRVIGVTLSKNSDNVYCNVFHRYLINSKMTKGKSDFSIQITRDSINNCLGTIGIHFNFVTHWLRVSLQPCNSALIGRHNVWEFWDWTELTANYRSLPVQSERALEPSRELLDFEKCLLSLASPVTVTLL